MAGHSETQGWEYLFTDTAGEDHWSRPGKEPKGTSATVSPDGEFLYVFSTATPFEANRAYRKFAAYAILNRSDDEGQIDWAAASQDLVRKGYGSKAPSNRGQIVTVRLADVKPENVEFLWDHWFPRGKAMVVAETPTRGSLQSAFPDLAAPGESGMKMPMSGTKHLPASVLILTAEDGLADTVSPRLLAAGADLTRVHAIKARRHEDGFEAPISFPEDVDALRAEILRTGAELVIIDPFLLS